MAEDDAGQRFDLEVLHGGALGLSEASDLGLGELDVVDDLGGELAVAGVDLVAGEGEGVGPPLVEALGVVADGGVLAGGDVGEDALDGLPDGEVVVFAGLEGRGVLEVADHGRASWR